MKEALTIVKVGGGVVEDEAALNQLIEQFSLLKGAKILVHGGGRSATRMAEKLAIPTQMIEGRRVTDQAMLRIVTMVYGGLINKNIVALLQAKGVNAFGLTGVDGNVIRSHRRAVQDVDYGYVGDVDQVDALLLSQLIYSQLVPVVAPLTHDGQGSILNTNADTIAGECAKALSEFFQVRLIYCFEKNGVLAQADDEESVISRISPKEFKAYIASGVIQGGMIPKLDQAFDALSQGVQEVLITSHMHLDGSEGTQVVLDEK